MKTVRVIPFIAAMLALTACGTPLVALTPQPAPPGFAPVHFTVRGTHR